MLCENWALSGHCCHGPDHEPQLLKSVEIAFETGVRVPAKAIHSIPRDRTDGLVPSVDTMSMSNTNLNAVIQAYCQQHCTSSDPHCQSGLDKNLNIYLFNGESGNSVPEKIRITKHIHKMALDMSFSSAPAL